MREILMLCGIVAVWFTVQKYILPALGVRT